MPLSSDQLQVFLSWLNAKVDPRCPACGKNKWSVGDIIIPNALVGGKVDLGYPTISVSPMVQVICENCANVRLFSAVQVGIWEQHGRTQA